MTSPAGIYWSAVVLESFGLTVEPTLQFSEIPNASVNLSVTPVIKMQPPSAMALMLSPLISMAGGTRVPASVNVVVTPRIGWVPDTAMTLGVTPSISMAGRPVLAGRQLNVAVSRASTR